MSYGRPSPRPGELYNQYGPPRPPMGNAYAYSRSEAGGTRPSRPPQRYPAAEPYYQGASSRPAQRPHDYAGSSYQTRGPPPSGRRYNNEPPRGHRDYEPDNYSSFSRPSAMTDDRNPGPRKPLSSATRRPDARDHHQPNAGYSHGPPRRGNRPITPEEYYPDAGDAEHAQPHVQGSTEAEGSWSWNNLKKTVWGNSATDTSQPREMSPSPENDQVPSDRHQEHQNTLWAKLATVGATFQKKLHHDEGYASDASEYEGESHLIRIMKKYHIEKAESANDLPDWLFTQAELRQAQSRIQDSQYTNHAGNRPGRHEPHEGSDHQRAGGRAGLDDIYAAVDESRSGHARQDSKQSHDSGYGSSAEPPIRRRGRYEREAESAPKAPPGRNRLEQMSRHPPPAQRAYNQLTPSQYDDRPRQYHDTRRTEGARQPPPAPRMAAPTTVDYYPPSGQDDRYPTPASKTRSPYPPAPSSTGRRYVR
ncbi:hypothetical protein PSTG_04327 [Puccinia striiformis f. sp. tritici PST-78]|uniref:Mso1 N-terminal domain-containing protein n=1 Tax=Puccinia striiformis f. sp. tritici PST-78 TaxID=1165861 RepID=A0A0L0VTU9_9BASI|nr:hypothetical protein PSTG_04327 [Puccinia striiformis f. sp. tritici PST-78]